MTSRVVVALCAAGLLTVELARGIVVELGMGAELGAGGYEAATCNESIADAGGRRALKLHVERLPVGVPEKAPAGGEAELLWACGVACAAAARQIFVHLDASCLRVFCWGMLTCVTTGLGALPFVLVGRDALGERALALANAAASGMMLSASAGMLQEAHAHSGPWAWQLLAGLAAGAAFIRGSERLSPGGEGEEGNDDDVVLLHSALMDKRHLRKAWLIFVVMFCHSAAEGVAVGVAFSRQLPASFGLFVSLLLAAHNVPEGLAVSLVLVPRGVSVRASSAVAMLTSLPQPLMAVVAYLFVDAFRWLLPVGLAFAAGAMVYVCLHELLTEAAEQLGTRGAVLWTSASFALMSAAIAALHSLTADAL